MSTMSTIRMKKIAERMQPAPNDQHNLTLWRAKLRIQTASDDFLFRSSDEFSDAAEVAQTLLESSPSCKMVGAEIVAVERVARLWN